MTENTQDNTGKFVAVCKRECETCAMIVPVLRQIADHEIHLTVYTQDDPDFPEGLSDVLDDTGLEHSWRLDIETVPTLIRFENNREAGRVAGWDRQQWRRLTGIPDLGEDLPAFRPGCGAKNAEPGMAEILAVRHGDLRLSSRRISAGAAEDEIETCYARGWTDGLPVVPPTELRVVRMLGGTIRRPDEVIARTPPNLIACTVEKAAINAVMAGCKPEYLPVVLAAVEAACQDEFCLHGLLATTYFSGPVVLVNGPVRRAVGMNSGVNVFGQGNRANAAIGRALQLIIRNVGGGRPGEIDRATFGTPGKYGFCFAEDEENSPWEPFSVERGFAEDTSTVSLFAGGEVQGVFDQQSRDPESLCRTFAACLRAVVHPKIPMSADAVLAVSPEHGRVFSQAGWTKADVKAKLHQLLQLPGRDLVRGAGGIAEGVPEDFIDADLPKFRPGGLDIVFAGGPAGMFSAILGGWVATGAGGSQSVTREIKS
ncbi:MAG: thioredoxin family protein [Desulfobacteraceae bacterium]|nr:thioredoxin family protein [Desulfobacteraceae bacterium]